MKGRLPRPGVMVLFAALLVPGCRGGSAGTDLPDQDGNDAREIPDDPGARDASDAVAGPHLRAGLAVRSLPAPVGIPTAGYGQVKQADNPRSPFADNFAATRAVHTPPLVKAVAFAKGGETLVVARLDLIGVFGGFLDAVVTRLKTDHSLDLHGRVILSCTHTHAGPGRLADHLVVSYAADTMFPEFFDLVTRVVADTVAEAVASLRDAEVGVAETANAEAHEDRRCQNPPLVDDTLGVLAVRRPGEGAPFAVLVNYAVHGTVLDWQDLTLSRDAPGAVEDKTREMLVHASGAPVEVLFLQGAAGDAAPVEPPPDPGFADVVDIPSEWTSLEALGRGVARSVADALPAVTWVPDEDATIAIRTARLALDRGTLGYTGDEFPYPDGAIYCGFGQGGCLGDPGPPPTMDCLPMPEDPMVHQTFLTVARIGPVVLATMPGEPHAQVGLDLREALAGVVPGARVFVLGYSQSYLGYIMHEDDWRGGGYEPSMALWGWRFAGFAIGAATALLQTLQDPGRPFPYTEASPLAWSNPAFAPREAEASATGPAMLSAPRPVLDAGETVVVRFTGGDPWLGTPVVTLESDAGQGFGPHETVSGMPLTSLGPYATLDLAVEPAYETTTVPTTREFLWIARIPTTREIWTPGFPLKGRFRVRAEGFLRPSGQATSRPYVLVTDPFEVR